MIRNELRFLIAAAAAALALAVPAHAQTVPGAPPARGTGAPHPGQSRPAPAPAPSTPTAQPPSSQSTAAPAGSASEGQLSGQQLLDRILPIVARNVTSRDLGKLAAERGSSPQVKDVGQKMQQDFQRLNDEVRAIGKERGVDGIGDQLAGNDATRNENTLAPLRNLTGEQFDREFVSTATQWLESYEGQAKQLREGTPGKDARLKKWLDDAENVVEADLSQARQAKVALDKARGQAKR